MCQKHAEAPPFRERKVQIEMLNFSLKLTITGFRVDLRNLWLWINSLDCLKNPEMFSRFISELLTLNSILSLQDAIETKLRLSTSG